MTRFVLYAVPALTVLVVALSLLVVAAPRPVTGAQLYGGPSPDGKRLSLRVVVAERQGELTRPATGRPVRVELRRRGLAVASWEGMLDTEGSAAATLQSPEPLGDSPVVLVAAPWADEPLALGTLDIPTRDRWQGTTRVRGGWIESPRRGDLKLRVAPAEGTMAVPFETALLVEVLDLGHPAPNVELALSPESLSVTERPRRTNELGRAVLRVRPLAHVAALEVVARSPTGRRGRWYSTLPVVGGAMPARLSPRGLLVVQSPIARERAYFAIVTRTGRFAGGTIALTPDGRGGAQGSTRVERPADPDAWIVVSSEMDLAAPSTVGWPIGDATEEFLSGRLRKAPHSRAVSDALQLDGLAPLLRHEAQRQGRVRRLTALFVATATALVIMLLMLRVRDAQRHLHDHLARHGADARVAPSRTKTLMSTAIAALCVALGFLILALMAMLRE